MKNKFPSTKNLVASQHSGQFPPLLNANICTKTKQKTKTKKPRCVKYSPKKEGIGTCGSDTNLHMGKD